MPVVDSESRVEDILNVELGNLEPSVLQPPQSRVEALLMEIYNGGGGGGGKLPITILTSGQYDPTTGVPTISNPEENVFYLVPGGSSDNLYIEWVYTNGAWEKFGSATVDLTNYIQFTDYATSNTGGVVKIKTNHGLQILTGNDEGTLSLYEANATNAKDGTATKRPIVPSIQHASAFYGLAKAAGDTSQASSSNAIGIYTDNAKTAIKTMLGVNDGMNVVTVTGTSPTITAEANTQYICGEVLSLSFTPSAGGVCDVIFTSGSTLPVLTLPNTVIMPEWFELETNRVYEISISDGVYGAVMSWPTT